MAQDRLVLDLDRRRDQEPLPTAGAGDFPTRGAFGSLEDFATRGTGKADHGLYPQQPGESMVEARSVSAKASLADAVGSQECLSQRALASFRHGNGVLICTGFVVTFSLRMPWNTAP